MSDEKTRGFCKDCKKYVVVFRPRPSHLLHLVLSFLTFGLWVLVWIGLSIKIGGWRCMECGSKRITNTTSTFSIIVLLLLGFFVVTAFVNGGKQIVDKKSKSASNQIRKQENTKLVQIKPIEDTKPEYSFTNDPVKEKSDSSIKGWSGDWGNGIIAHVSNEPCGNLELINLDYNYRMMVSIPKSRLKKLDDAWEIRGDRAITVTGCWFKKSDNLIHAKIINKRSEKVTEQDFNMSESIWTAQ